MGLVKKLLFKEIHIFNERLKSYIKSPISLLDYIIRILIKRKGKQIRSLFVLLSGKINGGITETTYRAAACVEILHTATLIHDDVVDDAHKRRGFFSINALFKNKIAVLGGDYLLSKGMLLALEHEEYHILKILSDAIKKMSEAELLQLDKARNFSATEEVYLEIIKGKTASLIGAACALGVKIEDPLYEEKVKKMFKIGENIGIAFQIKDDVMDYELNWIGKPVGQDIRDKKLTLPLIYGFKKCTLSQKREWVDCIKKGGKNEKKIKEIIQFCKDSGAIDDAKKVMTNYVNEAVEVLKSFDNTEGRMAFEELIYYVIERKI